MKLKLLKFKSVKSTNDVALRLIKKRYYRPTIISSEKQTKGRGTMGKKWISKKGNLFLTIFFELNQQKIDFKKFAILNAYLIKAILEILVFRSDNRNSKILLTFVCFCNL